VSTDSRTQSPVRLGLLVVLAVAVLGAAAWSLVNERGDDDIVVSIDDFELTFADLDELLSTNPSVDPGSALVQESMDNVANLLATTVLVETAATDLIAEGYDPADFAGEALLELSNIAGFDPANAYGAWSIRLDSVQRALDAWSREQTLARSGPATEGPEYLCSSHILLDTLEEAEEVVALLADGADFAALAQERSVGPSGPSGGDLGCVESASFVPEFSVAAGANGPGITPPVQTQFGWHVIEVRSVGPLSAENHPEIPADELELLLFDEETRTALGQEFIQRSVDRAIAESHVDARFGSWDPVTGRLDTPSGVRG
jgi:hypothetical protein